jgi:CBS domain containing-hemolysin-like protein
MSDKASTLAALRTKVEGVNDWLVDAENDITDLSDLTAQWRLDSEFSRLHGLLDQMLQRIVDMQNEEEE